MLCGEDSCLQVLGTEDLYEYLTKYGLQLDPQLEGLVGQHTKKPWAKFINADNEHLVSEEAIDFLDHILRYDHQERLTCQEAMAHHYFDPVREEIMAQANAENGMAVEHVAQ
jgi:casein kinase II subunit alpha